MSSLTKNERAAIAACNQMRLAELEAEAKEGEMTEKEKIEEMLWIAYHKKQLAEAHKKAMAVLKKKRREKK